MSEPVSKHRTAANLDDFERRTRQATPKRDGDPLAELARLVGEPYDPLSGVFGTDQPAPVNSEPSRYKYVTRDRRNDATSPSSDASARPFGDFASIEAGLRGGMAPERDGTFDRAAADQYRRDTSAYGTADPVYRHDARASLSGSYAPADPYATDPYQAHGDHDEHHQDPLPSVYAASPYGQVDDATLQQAQHWAGSDAVVANSGKPSSKRPMILMAAAIAVGVAGIGVAYALKGRIASSPRDIKTITADNSPTKVQPPQSASDAVTQGDASVGAQTPTSTEAHQEQPVDLTQAVQDNSEAARLLPGSPASVTDASSVPVPPSPGQIQTAMADPHTQGTTTEPSKGFGLPDLPQPKRVKVVSVRPDGTIMPTDEAAPAAPPMQAPDPAPVAPPKKSSATTTRGAKSAASKTTTRAAAPKTIDSLAAGDDGAAAPVETRPTRKAKPQKVATAEPDAAGETAPAAATAGGFAVQLAAPANEAEAKAAASRFSKKFVDALAGRKLGYRKAESNGKSVYRVRVSSLSRADAVSLCEKLKADGGSCFIAKN